MCKYRYEYNENNNVIILENKNHNKLEIDLKENNVSNLLQFFKRATLESILDDFHEIELEDFDSTKLPENYRGMIY